MFILFGSKLIENVLPSTKEQKTYCSNCRKETLFSKVSGQTYFYLFLLPVFPISGKKEYTKCETCNNLYKQPFGWEELEKKTQKLYEQITNENSNEEKNKILGKFFDQEFGNILYDGLIQFNGKIYKFQEKKRNNLLGTFTERKLYILNDLTKNWELESEDIAERVIKEGTPLKKFTEKE